MANVNDSSDGTRMMFSIFMQNLNFLECLNCGVYLSNKLLIVLVAPFLCDLFFWIGDDGISNSANIKMISLRSRETVDMAQSLSH